MSKPDKSMNTSERRIYRNLGEFFVDFRVIMSRRKEIRSLMQGEIDVSNGRSKMVS